MTAKAIAAALIAAIAVPASAADIAKLSAVYGARQSVWAVQLSPEGDKIVYFTPAGTRGTAAVVADIATGATKVLVSNPDNKFDGNWCRWKSQQRIICNFYAVRMLGATRVDYSRLLSFAADGSSSIELGARPSDKDLSPTYSAGNIIDWLPDDPKRVMMSVYNVEKETIGTLVSNRAGLSVKLVDVENNRMSIVEPPNAQAIGYGSDNHGNVRFKMVGNRDTDGYARDTATFLIRSKSSKEWQRIGSTILSGRSSIDFEGFDETGDSFFVMKDLDGRKAIYKLAADGSDRSNWCCRTAMSTPMASGASANTGGRLLPNIRLTRPS